MAEWLAQWLPADASGRALELGAGPGVFTRRLLPWGGTLTASDLVRSMCSAGRMRCRTLPGRRCRRKRRRGAPGIGFFRAACCNGRRTGRSFCRLAGLPGCRVAGFWPGLFVEGSLPEWGALAGEPAPLTWRKPAEWSASFARRRLESGPGRERRPGSSATIPPAPFCARCTGWVRRPRGVIPGTIAPVVERLRKAPRRRGRGPRHLGFLSLRGGALGYQGSARRFAEASSFAKASADRSADWRFLAAEALAKEAGPAGPGWPPTSGRRKFGWRRRSPPPGGRRPPRTRRPPAGGKTTRRRSGRRLAFQIFPFPINLRHP